VLDSGTVIAVLALVSTIGSFWWIWVRRGHLEAYEPQTYACYMIGDSCRLRLPLAIYNTGARTLVVTDLRAVFVDQDVRVPVISFRHSIKPLTGDVADFAHPFAVAGRQTASRFVEFGRRDWAPDTATEYRVRVDVRTGDDGHWSGLVTVVLTTPQPDKAGVYIAHRRDPRDDAPPLPVVDE
jgi:hypothetical protein